MAAGLAPPRRVFAHGWWTVEGEKMSKSLGNFIPPQQLVDTYGVDPVRYFMLRELPFGSDGDFSHRAVVGRLNGDLANDFGNLAQRVLVMINRDCGAVVPEPGPLAAADQALLANARRLLETVRMHMEEQAFHLALETIWRVVAEANRYVDEQAPWVLRRSDPERMRTVLYTLAETIRHLAILAQPFVPACSREASRSARGARRVARLRRACRGAAGSGDPIAKARGHLSRALSKLRPHERRRGQGGHAGRQPLPSRLPRLRRRARRGHCSRAGGGRRDDADDRHAARRVPGCARDRRSRPGHLVLGRGPSARGGRPRRPVTPIS